MNGNLTIPDEILREYTNCSFRGCNKPATWKDSDCGMIQSCDVHFNEVYKRINAEIRKFAKMAGISLTNSDF